MILCVAITIIIIGTCAAAGYTGGCCTSGSCRGMPPTCSCDSICVVFQDCCVDVPPSCQPGPKILIISMHKFFIQVLYVFTLTEIDVLEFIDFTVNVIAVLAQDHSVKQLHCSVRASRVTNFEWTFLRTNHSSGIEQLPQPRQITNEVGALDAKFSVVSTDYSSVLTIEGVEFSDAGNYTCIASIGDRISPIMGTTIFTVYGMEIIMLYVVCYVKLNLKRGDREYPTYASVQTHALHGIQVSSMQPCPSEYHHGPWQCTSNYLRYFTLFEE